MSFFMYAFTCSTILLEALLLWRLSIRKSAYRYPFLTAYILYVLFRDFGLLLIFHYTPSRLIGIFWQTETVSLFLRFLVNWEFIRNVFPRDSVLHGIAWKSLLAVEFVALPCVLWLISRQAISSAHTHRLLSFEQYLSLCQAVILLVPAVVAWYYRVAVGRHMRGICLGFGTYVSVSAINFASLDVFRSFFRYGRFLAPITFIAMIVIWLCTFWRDDSILSSSIDGTQTPRDSLTAGF
jgi:hypothetical protein